jgi:hypothetical protein
VSIVLAFVYHLAVREMLIMHIENNIAFQGNTDIGGNSVEIPFVIQYLNSGIGLLIVLISILQVPKCRNVRIRIVIMKYWLIVALITTVIMVFRLRSMEVYKLDDLLTSVIGAFAFALLVTSVAFKQGKIKDAWKKPAISK